MLDDDKAAQCPDQYQRYRTEARARMPQSTISRREQYPEWRLSLVSAINHDYYYLLCIIIISLPRLPLPESVGQSKADPEQLFHMLLLKLQDDIDKGV